MRGLTDLYSDSFLNYRLLIQKVAVCSLQSDLFTSIRHLITLYVVVHGGLSWN